MLQLPTCIEQLLSVFSFFQSDSEERLCKSDWINHFVISIYWIVEVEADGHEPSSAGSSSSPCSAVRFSLYLQKVLTFVKK